MKILKGTLLSTNIFILERKEFNLVEESEHFKIDGMLETEYKKIPGTYEDTINSNFVTVGVKMVKAGVDISINRAELAELLEKISHHPGNIDVEHYIKNLTQEKVIKQVDLSEVNRLELVTAADGRFYTNSVINPGELKLSYQDNNKTLKIFINNKK